MTERELGAATAGVEDDQRPFGEAEPVLHGEVGEAPLLLPGDDLHGDAGACEDGRDHRVAVASDAQACRAHRGDRERAAPARLIDHAGDRRGGSLQGRKRDLSVLLESFTEAGHLGSVYDSPPTAACVALPHVELDGVGAHVDDGVPGWDPVDERDEALRIACVDISAEADRADGGDDGGGILGFDGDGPRGSPVRDHLGELRGAAADGVPDAPLVDRHGAHRGAGLDELSHELVERVGLPGARRRREAERLEHLRDRRRGEWEARLHDRPPLLEALAVNLYEDLDVHEVVTDLDVVTGARQQIQLVAFLDTVRCERGETVLRGPEPPSEGAPLPARDDHGHDITPWAARPRSLVRGTPPPAGDERDEGPGRPSGRPTLKVGSPSPCLTRQPGRRV